MEPFYHINSRITNNTPVKREPFEAADRLTAWVHTLNELNMSNSLVGNNTALDQHTQAKEKQAKQERERERERQRQRDRQRDRQRGEGKSTMRELSKANRPAVWTAKHWWTNTLR